MYYLIIEKKQEGPFSADELLKKGVKRNTLVWHQGLTDWTPAIEVKELIPYFLSVPPENSVPSWKNKKQLIIIAAASLLIFIVGRCVYKNSSSKDKQIQEYKHSVETLTNQNLEQQKLIESLQTALSENIDKNRKLYDAEIRTQIESKRQTYLIQLQEAQRNLNQAIEQLDEVNEFQLLRMSWEKEKQVRDAENEV